MKTTAREGQCLVDIALATTGATEGVWALALRNGVSVTGVLECGTAIEYESEDVVDARTAERYATERITPATAVSDKTLSWLLNKRIIVSRPDFEEITVDPVRAQATRAAVFTGEFTAAFS